MKGAHSGKGKIEEEAKRIAQIMHKISTDGILKEKSNVLNARVLYRYADEIRRFLRDHFREGADWAQRI